VLDLDHAGRIAAARDRPQGGENVGMRHRDAPGAIPAHGMAHQENAFYIDPIIALDLRQHIHHVLLRGAAIHGGGFASFGADRHEAHPRGLAFECAAVLIEHAALVAAHPVQ